MDNQILFICLVVCPLAANFVSSWSGLLDHLRRWIFYRRYTKKTPYRFVNLPLIGCSMCLSAHMAWITALVFGVHNIYYLILLCWAGGAMGFLINKLEKL
jgi:hypothetical protein